MDSIRLRSNAVGIGTTATSVSDTADGDLSAQQQVLGALAQHEGLTRSGLAAQTSLPRSTVSAVVRRLVADGLVQEYAHGTSTGGRRPTVLRLAPAEGTAYVAELGEHHARIGIASFDGTVLVSDDVALDIREGQDATIDALVGAWKRLIRAMPGAASAVGLAVPGPVDAQGRVTGAARMPGWSGRDLVGALAEATALPVIVENDARASAIGEWSVRGEHTESCIYVKAGTGIGAGWITGGIAHRGSRGFAGDVTHLRIQTDSPRPCSCGNSGCLETVASGAAILRQLAEAGRPFGSVSQIIAAAASGDPTVTALVRTAGARLGEVLSSLVNFLNPTRIVLGGSMSQMGVLLAGLRTELYDRCLPMCTEELAIETSRAGADAPLIGMSVLARQFVHHQQRIQT